MRVAALWLVGLAVSAGLHVALFAALAFATSPDPLVVEPEQSGRIRMESYEVSETNAQAQDTSGEQAPEQAPAGQFVAQGPVRSEQAQAVKSAGPAQPSLLPNAMPVTPVDPLQDQPEALGSGGQQVQALSPETVIVSPLEGDETVIAAQELSGAPAAALFAQGAVVMASSAIGEATQAVSGDVQIAQAVINADPAQASLVSEAAMVLASGTPPAMRAKAANIQGMTIGQANAQPDTLLPRAPRAGVIAASSLITEISAQISVNAEVAPPQAPPASQAERVDQGRVTQAVPQASAKSETVVEAPPQTVQLVATTGWAGTGDAPFDPVSLAAVQSFMQPLDANAGALSARDSISNLLSRLPCSRLSATFVPESGILELRGHVPDIAMREPILNAIRAQLGESIPVGGSMLVLPSPQCDVLSALENLGLPQSDGQQRDPMRVGATTQISSFDYGEGERVIIKMRSPDYPAYVYVDFFDVDGRVLHLRPNRWESVMLHDPDTPLEIGADRDGESSVNLIVRPPFGQELAIAYASSEPLYEGLRETIEPSGPYLDFMRERIAQLRAEHPDYKGEWVYMFVQTHAAKE